MIPYQPPDYHVGLGTRESMLDKPESTQVRQYRILIIVLCVIPPILALRFVARHLRRMPFGWDDGTLLMGFVLVYIDAGMEMMSLHSGLAVHTADLRPDEIVKTTQGLFAFDMIYIPCLTLLKLSVLLMYRRIFPIKIVQVGSIILGILVLAWTISAYFIAILQCNPPAKLWKPDMPGFCLNSFAVLIGPGIPNFVTDIFILALPVKPILGLRVSMGRKMLIIFTFLTGFFVVGVSIYRLIVQASIDPQDMTYSMSWCMVELGASVVSCCLPTLMPVVSYVASQFAWGRRWLKQDQTAYGTAYTYQSGTSGRGKQIEIGSTDDLEQPLTTLGDSKDPLSPNHTSTWQIHGPKEDWFVQEERNTDRHDYDLTKPAKAQEPGPMDVEMNGLDGIRVMQRVEIMNQDPNHARP